MQDDAVQFIAHPNRLSPMIVRRLGCCSAGSKAVRARRQDVTPEFCDRRRHRTAATTGGRKSLRFVLTDLQFRTELLRGADK